jgi:hypothetical protein
MRAVARLRVYRFAAATYEGWIIGALERLELIGDIRLLDALLIARDATTGELEAIDRATGRADGTMAAFLDFRLSAASRRETTSRTLAPHPDGVPAGAIEALAATLEPGGALLAVLVAGGTPAELEEAVARGRGRLLADEPVPAGTLAEVVPRLQSAL